jgi:acetylornithine/succinyldiaminopimelate/putrescine aminotransferase
MTDTNNQGIKLVEDKFSVPSYGKWPVAFVRGKGCTVWDADGNAYLDLYGGHCVASLGHSHPHWALRVAHQAETLGFYSNVAYNDVRAAFHAKLVEFAPDHIVRVFMCNSGSEANETAVKLAMKATGRTDILAMEGGFHGRTAGALSITHLGHYRDQFPAVVRDTVALPLGDLAAVEQALTANTAAVIFEPIQSMNGVNHAEPSYYQDLVKLCHDNGTLVIFDEVQTGMGRLGAPFAADFFNAEVDLITSAKSIGNGFPMAAVLTTEAVSDTVKIGEQGTTFGGGPMACAAGLAVLEVIEEENLVAHAAKMGQLASELLVTGPVTGIRGHGLLLGLEMSVPAKEVCGYLFKNHILMGTSSVSNVARLMPPLVVQESDFEQLRNALNDFDG